MSEIDQRLEFALHIALQAERIILAAYQDPGLKSEFKSDKSVVTSADRASEKCMRDLLAKAYPRDAIIGEEGTDTAGDSGFGWILDPIDGTQSFVCGVPLFGTLVGVTYEDKPILGVCHMPAIRETYYAARGQGAWWKTAHDKAPKRAQVSTVSRLSDALFTTTSHSGFDRAGCRPLLDRLMDATKKFRGWGSCHGHMLVATGRADVMVEPSLKIWDCAALEPIVTEAGGQFFDLKGQPRIDGGSGVSTNAILAEPVKRLISASLVSSSVG